MGSLIGKGGAVISAIRASSGATVRVMPATMLPACANRGDELLQITAPARDAEGAERDADAAAARVRRRCAPCRETPARVSDQDDDVERIESYAARGVHDRGEDDERRGWGRRRRRGTDVHAAMNLNGVVRAGGTEITFVYSAPVSKTGSVIGRNGEVVQQIRSEIGAKIKV